MNEGYYGKNLITCLQTAFQFESKKNILMKARHDTKLVERIVGMIPKTDSRLHFRLDKNNN